MQQVNGLDLKSSDLRLDQIILKSEHSVETSAQKAMGSLQGGDQMWDYRDFRDQSHTRPGQEGGSRC